MGSRIDTLEKLLKDYGYVAQAQSKTVSLTIPSTLNVFFGAEKFVLPAPEVVLNRITTEVKQTFAELFGGYSTSEVVGGWRDTDTGALIEEKSLIVFSYVPDILVGDARAIVELAKKVRDTLAQDSVLVQLGSDTLFVGWRNE